MPYKCPPAHDILQSYTYTGVIHCDLIGIFYKHNVYFVYSGTMQCKPATCGLLRIHAEMVHL